MEALCHQAVDADPGVSWFSLETLAAPIGRAQVDGSVARTIATATVDRLMHHAHMVETSGESHRLAEALAGRGVVPLT